MLLRALAIPGLEAWEIVEQWIAALWPSVPDEWTTRFCRRDNFLGSVQEYVERTPDAVRLEIYAAFVRENRVARILAAGGDFRGLETWRAAHRNSYDSVAHILLSFYGAIYRGNTGTNPWPGYQFKHKGAIVLFSRVSYLDDFRRANPKVTVCPYCDGEMDLAQLDHFYPESKWQFFCCSPFNLIPICFTCNSPSCKHMKVPLDSGPPNSAANWLHPYLRTGAKRFSIQLVGNSPDPVPELRAFVATEQRQFDNAASLVDLRRRWQTRLRSVFADLKSHIRREVREAARQNRTPESLDATLLEIGIDADENAGTIPSALLRRAVCEAAIFGRADYRAELVA